VPAANGLARCSSDLTARAVGVVGILVPSEAAQLVLGHSSAMVTDAVYAERDMTKVVDVIRRVG